MTAISRRVVLCGAKSLACGLVLTPACCFANEIESLGRQRKFIPVVVPSGFSKSRKLRLRSGNDVMTVLSPDGTPTPLAFYLLALASDSRNVEIHFRYLFSAESANWKLVDSPKFRGWEQLNQGHRLPRLLQPFAQLIKNEKAFASETQSELMSLKWVMEVEKMFRAMIGPDGLLAQGERIGTMALSFHFLRTGWKQMNLRPEKIYTLEKAQLLVRSLLTKPEIINPDDMWLPACGRWLEKTRSAHRGRKDDGRVLIEDEKVFFCGGLFIGWRSSMPSCHATWDALAILNILFDLHPESNLSSPKSIYYLWSRESEETKDVAKRTFHKLCRRLWLDYREKGGSSYCWILDGAPVGEPSKDSETAMLSDHAGYSLRSMAHWSKLCWEEIYGKPDKNSTRGVNVLLANLAL